MKKTILLLFMATAILLTGCSDSVSEDIVLEVFGNYGVPGMPNHYPYDLEVSHIVLERDSYGRILFEYTAESIITDEEETAWVICQKYDDDYVYYYEDMCYYLGVYSEEAILALKAKNGWNKEMNVSKLSKREVTTTYDGYIDFKNPIHWEEERQRFCAMLQTEYSQITVHVILDSTESSELFWVEFKKDGVERSGYFLMTQTASAFLEAYEHIQPEKLAAFKQENGWK